MITFSLQFDSLVRKAVICPIIQALVGEANTLNDFKFRRTDSFDEWRNCSFRYILIGQNLEVLLPPLHGTARSFSRFVIKIGLCDLVEYFPEATYFKFFDAGRVHLRENFD